jgi:ribosomal protein S18 acetylase RimI-like enzyme
MVGDDDFRPEYTWLAFENDQPIAFLITDIDSVTLPCRAGWITQLGSHPSVRRRGISAALLVKAMEAYRAEGLNYITLMVNDNNPKAQALYHKVGLEVFRYRGKYEKHIR